MDRLDNWTFYYGARVDCLAEALGGTVTVPKGAVASLPEALAALHALVGAPDDRQLEHYASLTGRRLARSTANNLRHGRAKPRLETVEAFIAACLTFAETRKPPVNVPAEYRDMKMWQVRYDYFTEVTAATHRAQTPDRLALSTQLPRLRNSPARLLDPQNGVVEFMGRVDELIDLLTWCEDDSVGRLRLITGPGGIGKTRLALELTAKLKELQWRCEWVGDRQEGKYSEIAWLPMSRIASTSTNADRLTGLPNTYAGSACPGSGPGR
jgi:hypothetical protein